MIIFENVSKTYPAGNTVLDAVSFEIHENEFVVLTGPSGAGKTTIGKLLIKDTLPSAGRIQIDGQYLDELANKDLSQLRRKIGIIFQDYKIIPDKTVEENIALALEIINFPKAEIQKRVEHLLELVGIPEKAHLFPLQLSGGELQRAAIARAIVPEPKILFADEPTGNLDDDTASEIYELLKSIHELGTTVVMSTHNRGFMTKGHRHIQLKNGKIEKDDGHKEKSHKKDSEAKQKLKAE